MFWTFSHKPSVRPIVADHLHAVEVRIHFPLLGCVRAAKPDGRQRPERSEEVRLELLSLCSVVGGYDDLVKKMQRAWSTKY